MKKSYNNRINILHLVNQYSIGGAEVVLANLCRHSSSNINNIICSFNAPDETFVKSQGALQTVVTLQKRVGNDFRIIPSIISIIKQHNINIVHAQGWATYLEGLIAAKINLQRKCKFIFAFHGKTIEDIKFGIFLRRILAKKAASYFTDKIIAPSNNMADDYCKTFRISKKRICTIYNGIDLNHFAKKVPNAKEKIGINANNYVVGFVGRLDPIKNLTGLFTTFNMFLKKLSHSSRKNITLLLVGDGEEKNKLKKLSQQLGLENQIVFFGPSNNVPRCLSAMDVYIQPSLYEGNSITIIEAMAASLPVISTDVGGTSEIINNDVDGFLSQPDDYACMANKLFDLYNSPSLRQKIGTAGKMAVYSKFSVERMVEDYEQLYNNVLNG